ncbi:hypothetical protein OAP32_00650 [Crocinitomicaceae bacterium]|nr:hypothetical protein [Crocinitomicaceae bacterium]
MANPFQWNQTDLKDTGVSSQMGIRTAQDAVTNIGRISDDFQADSNRIQQNNIAAQGKLNNVELVNKIKGYTSSQELADAQGAGGELSTDTRFDQFGVNYDEAKAQQAIDDQQLELATTELNRVRDIPKTEAEMLKKGVGGFNTMKSQILDYAQNSSQREALNQLVDTQTEAVMVKQNKLIIDDAVAKFGGITDVDNPQHKQGLEYAVNQAEKAGYTKTQIDRIKQEYNEAELTSNELQGSQNIRYSDATTEQAAKESAANAHIVGELEANVAEVNTAYSMLQSLDLQDDKRTNKEIADAYAKGDDVTGEHVDAVFSQIHKLGAVLQDEEGNNVTASAGRTKAIFAAVLESGVDLKDDDAVEQAVIHQIKRNNSEYTRFKSQHLKAVTKQDNLLKAQLAIRNEGRAFGLKAKQAAKKDEAMPKTQFLDDYLNNLGLATGNNTQVVKKRMDPQGTQTANTPASQAEHYAVEQQQLDDNFTLEEQQTMKEEGQALVSDPAYSFLSTEMHGSNPTFGNFQFASQNQELEAAGADSNFVLPSSKISAGNYAEQGSAYINRYNSLNTGKPVSTAAGPFQLTSTNVAKAIDAGVITEADPMGVNTQAKIATWLMTDSPSMMRYLTATESSGSVTGDNAISDKALRAFGNTWEGIKNNPDVGKQSLAALRKQIAPVVARAKIQGKPLTRELIMEALMPKNLVQMQTAKAQQTKNREALGNIDWRGPSDLYQ